MGSRSGGRLDVPTVVRKSDTSMTLRVLPIAVVALLQTGSTEAVAVRRTDPRVSAVERFWDCLRGKPCPAGQVFDGAKALKHWALQQSKQSRYRVALAKATLVPSMTDRDWMRRWQAAVPSLEKAGFWGRELRQLGAGRAVVQASANVALVLTRNVVASRGQTSTTVLVMVLWRRGGRWRLAAWECGPAYVSSFLLANKVR